MATYPNLELELAFWLDGYLCVAGLDEAGRGSWAGPVVAGAVILPAVQARTAHRWARSSIFRAIARVNDSKQLSSALRESLLEPIRACALACATGEASHLEIDELGILAASKLAMYRALERLGVPPEALLLDALVLPEIELPQIGVVHGDGISLSIAAGSVLAKVTRDRMMCDLDLQFPGYGFAQHKGYGTPEHQAALHKLGPCPVHRRSYEPIQLSLAQGTNP